MITKSSHESMTCVTFLLGFPSCICLADPLIFQVSLCEGSSGCFYFFTANIPSAATTTGGLLLRQRKKTERNEKREPKKRGKSITMKDNHRRLQSKDYLSFIHCQVFSRRTSTTSWMREGSKFRSESVFKESTVEMLLCLIMHAFLGKKYSKTSGRHATQK